MAQSAYDQTDLVQMIRDEINEPTARVFSSGTYSGDTTTDLERFIDMGAMECAALTNGFQVYLASITPLLNISNYAISTTTNSDDLNAFTKVESVEYIESSVVYGLQRANPLTFGGGEAGGNTAGRPRYYFIHHTAKDLRLWVWPAASSNEVDNGTITVRGYGIPTGFGSATNETLTDGLQLIPLYYALSCVYARLGKHGLSAYNMQKFFDECNRWRRDIYGAINRVDSQDMARIPDVSVTVQ